MLQGGAPWAVSGQSGEPSTLVTLGTQLEVDA